MILYWYDGERTEFNGVVFRRLELGEVLRVADVFDCGWSSNPPPAMIPIGPLVVSFALGGRILDDDIGHYWRPIDPLIAEMIRVKELNE